MTHFSFKSDRSYSRQLVYLLILNICIMHSLAGEVYFHCNKITFLYWCILKWSYMLFYKVWFCFGGVLEHALIFQYLSPQPDTNGEISSGFDEGPPSEKRNMLWLVGCPSALWLVNRLHYFSIAPPLPKRQVHQYYISIQWKSIIGPL